MKRQYGEQGFILATLICFLTAAAILAAITVPARVQQSRREVEEELIFRGEEYIRAIQKYQRKYGAYPTSVEDLLSRDGYRFLRHQYKDPITGDDFRVINVNPDGSLTGALTMFSVPIATQQIGGGVGGAFGQVGDGGRGGGNRGERGNQGANPQANTSNVGSIANFGAGLGTGGNSGVGGFGNPLSGGATNNRGGGGNTGIGTAGSTGIGNVGGAGAAFGGGIGAFGGVGALGNPLGTGTGQSSTALAGGGATGAAGAPQAGAASLLGGNPFGGGGGSSVVISPGVAGVASESTATSIKVYNEKEKYNEWEFIAALEQTLNLNQNQVFNNGGGAGFGGGGGNRGDRGAGGRGAGGATGGGGFGGGNNPFGAPAGGGGNNPFGAPTGGGGGVNAPVGGGRGGR